MGMGQALKLGRPIYPAQQVVAEPAALAFATNARAQQVYAQLRQHAAGASPFRFRDDIAKAAIQARLDVETIEASYLAGRIFSAENIALVVSILCRPSVRVLLNSIEQKAKILATEMLIGDMPNDTFNMLCFHRVMGLEMSQKVKPFREVFFRYLTITELNDDRLVDRLVENEAERTQFVEDRAPKLENNGAYNSLVKALLEELRQLAKEMKPIKGISLFWSPFRGLKEEVTEGPLNELNWTLFKTVVWADKFLTHDLSNSFSMDVVDGYAFEREGHDFDLRFVLHGYKDLTVHIDHLIAVLEVSKYRLDGIIPPVKLASLKSVAETAAKAAAYRWQIPFNDSGDVKKGQVNLVVEDDAIMTLPVAQLGVTFYNLIKNSLKAINEAGIRLKEAEITIRLRTVGDVTIVEIEDNANGFNVHKLLKAASDATENPANAEIVATQPIFQKIGLWKKKPNVLRVFTMGELFDIAFIATISGFSDKSISSGLGMNEVAEVMQRVDGDVLITDKYEGGAMITLVMGPQAKRELVIASLLGEEN